MRKEPGIEPPEDITPLKLDIIERKRKYELITPLYGGGVVPNEADPVTIVRATEVRGQLRFWWRATRGGQSESASYMKAREDAIWGKAYEKGDTGIPLDQTVQIVIEVSQEGTAIKPFRMKGRTPESINDVPGYVAFPLQPDQTERKKAHPFIADVRRGVQFVLTIAYPDRLSKEIEAALWAWETFGGLGARMRRGFGALHLLEIDGVSYQSLPASRDVERWIRDEARKHIKAGSFLHNFPYLSRELQLVVTPSSDNPTLAWNRLIRKLQEFRLQKDEHNRSAWPEADAIRKIGGKSTKNIPAGPSKFPRAAFGLPIIFHFTGDDAPQDHTLNEADTQNQDREHKERFASPLILRPFLCRDKRAVGLALLLEGSRVDLKNLMLQDENKNVQQINGISILNGMLTVNEARAIAQKTSNSHDRKDTLWVLNKETDVLQAFMKSLKGV